MNNLTDKTWFLYVKGFQIWVDNTQAEAIRKLIDTGRQYLDIEGRRIRLEDCLLLKGEDNTRVERNRRGDYQCEFGYWHSKGQECGHDEQHK